MKKQFTKRISLLILLFLFFKSNAQDSVVTVSKNDNWSFVEPSMAINKSNDQNLVVASMAFSKKSDGGKLKVFYSLDGGKSWSNSDINKKNVSCSDPFLVTDIKGNFYLSFLPEELYKSTDGGISWTKMINDWPFDGFDYPKMAIDNTDSNQSGTLYLWPSRTDQFENGENFGPLNLFILRPESDSLIYSETLLPNNFWNQVGDIAVLSNGSVIASFQEIDVYGEYVEYPRLWVTRSDDGGHTLSNPFLAHGYFQASSPNMGVDYSGGDFEGRIYQTYLGAYNLEQRIFSHYLIYSDDNGEHWSNPKAVSDTMDVDYPPHSPAIEVNKNGVVGLSWRKPSFSDEGRCTSVFFSYSSDGGKLFSTSQISEVSCSNKEGNNINIGQSDVKVLNRFRDGGDYHGMITFLDGSFGIVWADSRSGIYQLYFKKVSIIN